MRDHGGNLDAAMARFGGCPRGLDRPVDRHQPASVPASQASQRTPGPRCRPPPRSTPSRRPRRLRTAAPPCRCRSPERRRRSSSSRGWRSRAKHASWSRPTTSMPPRCAARAGRSRSAETLTASSAPIWRSWSTRTIPTDAGTSLRTSPISPTPSGCWWSTRASPTRRRSCRSPERSRDNVIVLRSFGKFYGLAGIRLGFALAAGSQREALRDLAGPWPVSGPAIAVGRAALADQRLARADHRRGWSATPRGSTHWRSGQAGPSSAAPRSSVSTKRATPAPRRTGWRARRSGRGTFPYARGWLRLGLPDGDDRWDRLERLLRLVRPRAAPPRAGRRRRDAPR